MTAKYPIRTEPYRLTDATQCQSCPAATRCLWCGRPDVRIDRDGRRVCVFCPPGTVEAPR